MTGMCMTGMNRAIREIPFAALGGVFEQDDIDAALGVLQQAAQPGGDFFPLPEENDFQRAFAAHEGAAKAVAVNSCGTALDLCLMALGIGPGDEVITTPLTFVCTATCAIARSAKVVFADIHPETLCLDPRDVRRRITEQTKAILPVHFAGLAADCDAFDRITSETGIPIIYDAAHAVATKYRGLPIGGRGLANCYSFQSNKNMTTLGEGGAVTTNQEAFAEVVRQKKTFGYVYGPQLSVATVGFNYRMTKPQCAVGLTQLAKIDRVIARRLEVFQAMDRLLDDVDEIIRPAGIEPGHGCHLYVSAARHGPCGIRSNEAPLHSQKCLPCCLRRSLPGRLELGSATQAGLLGRSGEMPGCGQGSRGGHQPAAVSLDDTGGLRVPRLGDQGSVVESPSGG